MNDTTRHSAGAKGALYVHRNNREVFTLRVDPNDLYGRTHKLHNGEHHWEGTEAQFTAEFDRF